jgi:integrase/recombinase XerD
VGRSAALGGVTEGDGSADFGGFGADSGVEVLASEAAGQRVQFATATQWVMAGRLSRWSAAAARGELRRLAAQAGVPRRFAPHQLRHAYAIEMTHAGIPLPIIQRQLGHAHLGITSIYLQRIVTREIVDTVHHRRPPVIPASAGLRP